MSTPPLSDGGGNALPRLERALPVDVAWRQTISQFGSFMTSGYISNLIVTTIAPKFDAWVMLSYELLALFVVNFVHTKFKEYSVNRKREIDDEMKCLQTVICNDVLHRNLVINNLSSRRQLEVHHVGFESNVYILRSLIGLTLAFNILFFGDSALMNSYETIDRIVFVFIMFMLANVWTHESIEEHRSKFLEIMEDRRRCLRDRGVPDELVEHGIGVDEYTSSDESEPESV